jgi:glycerol kinase
MLMRGTKLMSSTGIPLSTYFSAIKLRWMIDHHPEVHQAHEEDDLMFGTVDTWLVYVSSFTRHISKLTSSP